MKTFLRNLNLFQKSWSRLGLLGIAILCGNLQPLLAASLQPVSIIGSQAVPAATASEDSIAPVVSADGHYVLFASSANNLILNSSTAPIPGLTSPKMNVYLRDRTNGTTILISVALDGLSGGNGDSFPVDISTNGQYVLFESSASNLVSGDTNGATDIFIRDLVNGTTQLISVATDGSCANNSSRNPAMTPDGRYVAFTSFASNLVSGDVNGIADIFVRDTKANTTALASSGAAGTITAISDLPNITPDGHYVVFYSSASNLIASPTTGGEIYVSDMVAKTIIRASAYAHTLYPSAGTFSFNHSMSDDGKFISYEACPSSGSGAILRYNRISGSTDTINTNVPTVTAGSELNYRSLDMSTDGRFVAFVGNTNNSATAIFVWDGTSNKTMLASGTLANNSVPAGSLCASPALDPTGRFVNFLSTAFGLVTNPVNGNFHLFLRDMQAGSTQLLDANSNGISSTLGLLSPARMSTNASLIAFDSLDENLVPNDSNRALDVFARNISSGAPELISVCNPQLTGYTANGVSTLSANSVRATGRYIAFSSEATNLAPNDTNGFRDVFVRDLSIGSNALVSVNTGGVFSPNGPSFDPSISTNGRYVAFTSMATNLVSNDANTCQDVFLRDLLFKITSTVSLNTSLSGTGNAPSYSPLISGDGHYVLFHSFANNLTIGISATNSENLYLRNLQSGGMRALTTNTVASSLIAGAMSPDGRYVAFGASGKPVYIWDTTLNSPVYTNSVSSATAVGISPDGMHVGFTTAPGSGHLYATDRNSNTTVTLPPTPSVSNPGLRFSGDGRYMVYTARTVTFINQIYLYNFLNRTNALISQNTNGATAGNASSDSPDISADGHYIAYRSFATNLGSGATNGGANLYLYNLLTGATALVSNDSGIASRSINHAFSADGQTLFFESATPGLAPGDFNQTADIFALSLSPTNIQPPFAAAILGGFGQSQSLSWPVTPGKNYQVQFKNQLSDPAWQVLNGTLTTNGNQASATDPTPSGAQRFYRIVSF